jgi:hypothetical protein
VWFGLQYSLVEVWMLVYRIFTVIILQERCKVHPSTGHGGPEGEYKYVYNPTLSLTSALGGVGGQHHAPVALPPGKTRYPLCWKLVGPQGRPGPV